MGYISLEDCINELEKTDQLIRIKEEVDPNLEMAYIHRRVQEAGGPALLFENVKVAHFVPRLIYMGQMNVLNTYSDKRSKPSKHLLN